MNDLLHSLQKLRNQADVEKSEIVNEIVEAITKVGYAIVEKNDTKPWGAYIRFDGSQADRFVNEFFPGLTPQDARLGVDGAELSPKILIVEPSQRLSWQYHNRRAERWVFITEGAYNRSSSDVEGEGVNAMAGDVVQFGKEERHRLVGIPNQYVIVAEIWQHADKEQLSDEDDIIRLADDYDR